MARETIKEQLAERHQPDQPALFDDEGQPDGAPVLAMVVARRYEHTGVRLLENEAKALRLVELLVGGWGVKRIAREMSISARTVRAARRALVAQGKMDPYVKRVTDAMEDAIEAGVCNYRDALEGGKIPAAQIPVGIGIMFDKRALARGEPTSISAARPALADELSAEAINAALSTLRVCNSENSVATDSQSLSDLQKVQQTGHILDVDASLDAGLPPETAIPPATDIPTATEVPRASPIPPATVIPPPPTDGGGGGYAGAGR